MKNAIKNNFIAILVISGLFASGSPALAAVGNPQATQAPTIQTNPLTFSDITQTTATLRGFFSTGGASTIDVRFQYGTTTLLGTNTSYQTFTTTSGNFSQYITGLNPGTTYYYRGTGISSNGTAYGTTLSFTTPIYSSSVVQTNPATNITSSGATLNGFFNGNGSTASVRFEYANNNSFVGSSLTPLVNTLGTSGNFSAPVTLSSGTYYFRGVVTTNGITVRGNSLQATIPQTQNACVITNFSASPSSINPGNSTTLSWNTTNCTNVSINNGIGSVSVNDSVTTGALSSTTTYTLTANNAGNGVVTSQATVTVSSSSNQCVIDYFYASPSDIDEGDNTTLYWGTTNCNDVFISNPGTDIGSVSNDGDEDTDELDEDTTFTITATGTNGSDSESETVTVDDGSNNNNDECEIDDFYAEDSTVDYGDHTTLYWETTDCDDVYITTLGSFNDANDDTDTDAIYNTTTFTLYAYGDGDDDSETITVYVRGDNGQCQYGQCPPPCTVGCYPNPDPVNPNPIIIYVNGTGTSSGDTVSVSTSSDLTLSIESQYGNVYVDDIYNYIIKYKNVGNRSLDNATLRIELPRDVELLSTSTGFMGNNRTVEVSLGTISPNESGSMTVNARVLKSVNKGDMLIAKAVLSGNLRGTGNFSTISAYANTDVTGKDTNSLLGLALFGDDGFLPQTFGGWLMLFLLVGAVVYIGRKMYEKPKPITHTTSHSH